ncbi:MAG: manganese efflux pump [Ruminococcaceae bacterium]|nr:manganese efflux pump [Oscillospiraceae bacterium]
MDFWSLLLIALGLAMDAFAVAVTNGVTAKSFTKRTAIWCALCYAVCQFVMPLIGWGLGTGAYNLISSFDHWIAFVLLAFIGGKMLIDSIKEMKEDCCETGGGTELTFKLVFMQGIATSIDALAVGISFAALGVKSSFQLVSTNIWVACGVIGIVAFVLPLIGGLLGKKIGCFLKNKAGLVGGLVLIGIGVKILLEHLLA